MSESLYIAIPCHNRKAITALCVPTVKSGIAPQDRMVLYNDGSDEYGPDFLLRMEPGTVVGSKNLGIEQQRRAHFLHFISTSFDFLYLTDSDALHDPGWRAEALRLHRKYDGAPVCLYNTPAHANMPGNTIEESDDVIWRKVAPGVSYLLSREHARKVCEALPHLPSHWNWDWQTPAILGHRMAVSKVSYVDHIGKGGLHHPLAEGYDGGDRAINPTPWLIEKRAEVVAKLKAQ